MSRVAARPMTDADVSQAALVSAAAFGVDISERRQRDSWEQRMRHPLITDPAGAFVTEAAGVVIGVSQTILRDGVWILSLLAVSPSVSRGGDGRALVDAALSYGSRTQDGLIVSSNDPRAMRLYASSGFRLQPTFRAAGPVDGSRIPERDPRITVVGADGLEALAPISRAVRGAAHTPDFGVVLARGATIFALEDRGWVAALPGRGVWALAALDDRAATALLWCALDHLRDEPEVVVGFLTADQRWALDVLLEARIPFCAYGALAVRGNPGPLRPYIPSPPFS